VLRLGPVQLRTPLLLAPIAGYCDLAFRTICREQGRELFGYSPLGLACTDLLSPQGLLRGTATSLDLAKTDAADKPVGMQLYGSDPEIMAQGARWAVEHGATIVDINMGCPVDKVTKKDGGSKLLTDLSRAVAIAERVVKELEKCPLDAQEWAKRLGDATWKAPRHRGIEASSIDFVSMPGCRDASMPSPVPLTCKIRLCWSNADFHAGLACSPHLARMLADVGVVGVTVHGRTTEMKFTGTVQLDGIARVVDSVNGRVPIIGNGDIREPEDALGMMARTGCDGVMIGRGALSTPWIFRDCWALMQGRERPPPPDDAEVAAIIRRYFDLMLGHRGEAYALMQIRRRISWFAKRLVRTDPESGRMVGVRPLREAMRAASDPARVHALLAEFAAGGLRSGGAEEATHEQADASV
jgi:tRNA-dihydrouridine synthase B